MQKLKAPAGMTDVSFGGQNYKVGDDGVVEVPDEATLTLFQFGFTVHAEPSAEELKAKAEAEAAAKAAAEAEEAQRKTAEEQAAQEAAAKAAAEAEAAKQAAAANTKAKK